MLSVKEIEEHACRLRENDLTFVPFPISEEFDCFGVVSHARLASEMSALLQYTSPARAICTVPSVP